MNKFMDGKWHSSRYIKLLSYFLWFMSLASLIFAWAGIYRQEIIFGFEPLAWYWNALIFGILACIKKESEVKN